MLAIEYPAKRIGHMALKVMSHSQKGLVIGTTSRGIFIYTADAWVIFISFERYCGPLTITLSERIDQLRAIQNGWMARISLGRLFFPYPGVGISVNDNMVWYRSIDPQIVRPCSERLESLKYFVGETVSNKESVGLGGILSPLLGLSKTGYPAQAKCTAFSTIMLLRETLRARDLTYASEVMCGLLGLGRGLTPSGDDLVMGLLLVINRWQGVLGFGPDLQKLNLRVLEAAYRRTTTLSANLIECAALGHADERIVNVVDCIFTGKPRESVCISGLLGWGASSGVDALVGMAVALTC